MTQSKLSPSHKALLRRYLTWAYKSTKESFDRLERKTTQLMADEFIQRTLKGKKTPAGAAAAEYIKETQAFAAYIEQKKAQPIPAGRHAYLAHRLEAVEGAIKYFLGSKELAAMKAAYEAEFTRRIWESKDH